jgi:16S rRNA (cytosine967-C5)-methyltransferase
MLMIETPRGMAVEILTRVETTDAYAEPLLDAYLSAHYLPNIHDKRLLTLLVYGVLRMRGQLDWIIGSYCRGRFFSLAPVVKNILRTGLYQLLYTNRIPVFAVVDEAVKLAKALQPENAALVNAVLRSYLRRNEEPAYPSEGEDPLGHIAVPYSHPRWLVKTWLKSLGAQETRALCSANNLMPPVSLRVNRLKGSRAQAGDELRKEGVETREAAFSPDGLIIGDASSSLRETESYRKGLIQMQDEASQLIARLAAPQPGERILDLCAGAGVKTTHLAEIMGNKGSILAVDINKKKLADLSELTKRLGVRIIEMMSADATSDMGRSLHQQFDRILVDAPCSGLGTLRRNPEIKWRLAHGDIKAFSDMQRKMLSGAPLYLKKGGVLVYSVCSVMREENEAVIEDFLRRNRNFRLASPPEAIDKALIDDKGFFRSSPARHGTDGFFAAVLVRNS